MSVLTMLDTIAIQRFIFASNRLRDIIGGSLLAERYVHRDQLEPEVKKQGGQVIFAAGGNALMVFPTLNAAKQVVEWLSRTLIEELPGFEIVVAHREFADGRAAEAIRLILQDINRAKAQRAPSAPILGLSVTEPCRQTGLPASHIDDKDGCIHATIAARRNKGLDKELKKRWDTYLPPLNSDGISFAFPDQLDEIGRTHGDTSLIGVIHVDGNGVGKKIEHWLEDSAAKPDAQVFEEYRAFSDGLAELAAAALRSAIHEVAGAVQGDEICVQHRLKFSLTMANKDTCYLPLRPIICSGDDITLVCDGRLSLSIAQALLEAFEDSSVVHLGPVKASAGVAIVGAHSPFWRAYSMAEEMCSSAKGFLRATEGLENHSALDWFLEASSPYDRVGDSREELYRTATGLSLTQRPYLLNGSGLWLHRSWQWLADEVIAGFTTDWKDSHNKVKDIPEIVRQGPEATKRTLHKWRTVHANLRFPGEIPETGFEAGRTALLDAVEILDVFLPLKGGR